MTYYDSLSELSTSQLKAILPLFTRNRLRSIARVSKIRQGNLKSDLIKNLSSIRNRSKLDDYIVEIKIY